MNQEAWEVAGDWAYYWIALSAVTFIMLYLLLAPWWKTQTGRNIAAMMGVLAIIGVYGTIVNIIVKDDKTPPPFFYEIRFFLFVGLAATITWRIIIFVKFQILARLDNHKAKKEKDHDLRS